MSEITVKQSSTVKLTMIVEYNQPLPWVIHLSIQ